eukprot:GHRR01015914.1.p2 GENE.GHRR01015914.1~~GHRR01015914.1.p2  ORF type:complete len:111 (+),score=44.83 GHRR01015914.1:925-1257(+)
MRPGEMLALMGPSGSGKTSLLSIISGRAARAVQTRGRVTSNGEKLTKAAKRRVGFVLQDDLLYEVCTAAAPSALTAAMLAIVTKHAAVQTNLLFTDAPCKPIFGGACAVC